MNVLSGPQEMTSERASDQCTWVTLAHCARKHNMLPPGMSFTAINARAWEMAQSARNPRRYRDWRSMVEYGRQVRFSAT